MNFLRKPFIKNSCAGFILVLFVFIQVIKTFHSHPQLIIHTTSIVAKHTHLLHENFSCPICDFQIAKDSDAVIATVQIDVPVHEIITYFHYYLPEKQINPASISVRGPPCAV